VIDLVRLVEGRTARSWPSSAHRRSRPAHPTWIYPPTPTTPTSPRGQPREHLRPQQPREDQTQPRATARHAKLKAREPGGLSTVL